MTTRPVLFNGAMVRAILDGRKTQTRRPIRPQPESCAHPDATVRLETRETTRGTNWYPVVELPGVADQHGIGEPGWLSPFGGGGDRLYVRETFARPVDSRTREHEGNWLYRADLTDTRGDTWGGTADEYPWRPSIHMPRAASRIVLRVKRVWVERVQEIGAEGVWAEGVRTSGAGRVVNIRGQQHRASLSSSARRARAGMISEFSRLWDAIYGKRTGLSWADNPWVFGCEFETVATEHEEAQELLREIGR